MSLKIQVLGKGLIPRGLGIAPRKEPFYAELNLIQTILATPGLSIKFVRPEDNSLAPIDKSNVMRIWNRYHEGGKKPVYSKSLKPAPAPTAPSTPAPKPPIAPAPTPASTPVVNTTPVNTNPTPNVVNTTPVNTTPAEPKKEEEKPAEDKKTESTDSSVFKPVGAPDEEKKDNNKNQNNNNKHK